MSKVKGIINRVWAFVLVLVVVFTVPEVSAAVSSDLDAKDTMAESNETNDVKESPTQSTIVYEEIIELGSTETSALSMSFFSAVDLVQKASGNHEKWIDRIQVSDDGKAFYNALVEAVDNDGIEDFLIEDDYFSESNIMGNYKIFPYDNASAGKCNIVEYTSISNTSFEFELDGIYAEMRAVYDAFDRDYPEVFWLSGNTTAAISVSESGGVYTATIYMVLKNHTDGFDIRSTEYQNETAIQAGISQRDNAINAIIGGSNAPTSTDAVEWITYFNDWLIKNNAYNTSVALGVGEYPASAYECLSALNGSIGVNGPVCEAYARAFKVLCEKKGIPCVLVDGEATSDGNSSEAHMWNYVFVDNAWYAVDVTWNDPLIESGVAVSGYESKDWLLLGADTISVVPNMTFIESHPVSNQASYGGVAFTNGPVLSADKYVKIDISSSVENQETIYGYGNDMAPTVTVAGNAEVVNNVTYQWYKYLSDDAEQELQIIDGATSKTMPSGFDAGTYAVKLFYGVKEIAHYPVVVNKKELIPNIVGSASKVYDGTTAYTGSELSISMNGIVVGDEISVKADFAYSDVNAGAGKKITATNIKISGDKANNYYIDNKEEISANVGTISQKQLSNLTITLDKETLYYNGAEQTVNVTVKDGDKVLVEGVDYTVTGNKQKNVDEYSLTVACIGNYAGAQECDYAIQYLDANVAVLYNGKTVVPEWAAASVTITAEGYTISDSLDGTYATSYVVSNEGVNSNVKLYFKNAEGYISDAKILDTIKIDKNAPVFAGVNDGIKVSANVWKELLNTITFGVFHIETQDVAISATDELSGVESYWYYVDKTGSTTVKTVEELDNATFTQLVPGQKFSIEEDGKYVIYAYASDKAGNKSAYICSNGLVFDLTKPEITNVVEPTANNGTLKDTNVTITFTASESGSYYFVSDTNASATYTAEQIAQNAANIMMVGENTFSINALQPNTYGVVFIVAKDTAGNLSNVAKVEFTTQKTLPVITSAPSVSGIYGTKVSQMTITGGVASVNGTPIEGTWSVVTDTADVPKVGTTKEYTVKFTPNAVDTYGELTVNVVPAVTKKDVIVTIADAAKKFGKDNPTFTFTAEGLVTGEAAGVLGVTLSTAATKTSNVGEYDIIGTANAENYNVTFEKGTLSITKAEAPAIDAIAKEYVYSLGSEGNVIITLNNLLPGDIGNVTYSAAKQDENDIIDALACGESDFLYSVKNTGNKGNTAVITVVATTMNYEDINITVNIKLVDKLSVSLKEDSAVTTVGSLTYGDTLSKLNFGETIFVDAEGNPVAGSIAWDSPNAKLNAGSNLAAWTFTPNNVGKYHEVKGTVNVVVAKANPTYTIPTGLATVYHPTATLADIALVSTDNGIWNWKENTIVPTVGTTEYAAVFTPVDSANYNTVNAMVSVQVTKATPVVGTDPTASKITYGDTLADSVLSNGVVYVENPNTEVNGVWSWKDVAVAPKVADSNTTEYEVVFTPNDTTNYNSVSTKITLVVEKAEWPDAVPEDEIIVGAETDVVGKVVLPEGWEWAEDDAETELVYEEEVTVTANYIGDDKDNFKNISKDIKITRNIDAPHIEGDKTTVGWDTIAGVIKDTTEGEVRVDMNGHSVVSGDVIEILKEENKTLVVIFFDEDGEEEYTWTIKGSDVKDGDVKALDMEVELYEKDATNKPSIPEGLVKEVIASAKDYKFISLVHNGKLGFKATLTINVGDGNAGKLATLYYYNEISGKLEETENVKIEVDADGLIGLTFEHASNYVLVMNEKEVTPPQDTEKEEVTPEPKPEPKPEPTPEPKPEPKPEPTPEPEKAPSSPPTGDDIFGNIYFYIALLFAGGLAGYIGVYKKRKEQA